MSASYNRSNQSLGNILHMEHVNIMVPEQAPAILFYVNGLGYTRDPFLMTGLEICGSISAAAKYICRDGIHLLKFCEAGSGLCRQT